jgi:hypothetical protein
MRLTRTEHRAAASLAFRATRAADAASRAPDVTPAQGRLEDAPREGGGITGKKEATLPLPDHQRFSSSPYMRAQSRRVIAQGARWAGLTAPGCALCGRKSLPRCTLGWHRRAPKARLELRWVHPGILQAHPGKYKGAPWLGRGPYHRQGTAGAPPRRTWSSAGCALGAPWDSAGAPERRGLRGGAPWLGQGSHCASPHPVAGLYSCALKARPSLPQLYSLK